MENLSEKFITIVLQREG